MLTRSTRLLLNAGHALDHMFLLIFATAVTPIAMEFGVQRWEDLMPYSVAAFFFFGIGALPAGRLGDLWGRRPMMIVFFIGLGASAIAVSLARSPLEIALGLGLLGCFAAIYHPVGIPMLLQGAQRPGWTIGVNGLCGNLGVAAAAVVTGLFVKYAGWRAAFLVPGLVCIALGLLFAWVSPRETSAPAARKASASTVPVSAMTRILLIMTLAATSSGLLFNFATSSNYELLSERLIAITRDPARLGLLLAVVYAAASLAQLVVGYLIDRYPLKQLYLCLVSLQIVFLGVASALDGWGFFALQLLFMATIFGAVPFTDAMIVRYVDDRMRSRISGMRLAVSLGASSLAVWLVGPVVKQAGFVTLIWVMVAASVVTWLVVSQLPATRQSA